MIEKVLKFWFGPDVSGSKSFEDMPCFTLEKKSKTIELVQIEFSDLIEQAEKGLLDDWLIDNRGKLALIVLLNQLSAFIYQNKSHLLKNNPKCLKISLDILENNNLETYSPFEQVFIVMPLVLSNDLTLAKKGLDLFIDIASSSENKQKPIFFKYVGWAKNQVDNFYNFNKCSQFLTLKSIEKKPKHINNKINSLNKKKNLYQKKILFLHGLRQNANKIKKRTFYLAKLLQECNVDIRYLDGTHPYKSDHEVNFENVSFLESQRVWYQSDEKNQVYFGIEESIEYVVNHVKQNGPYIGIIGFSQGAVLASLITKLYPNMFNFVINISGFKPRDLKYGNIFSIQQPFDFRSMQIYGKNDQLVSKERSEDFSKCFKNPLLFEHPDGHFVPLSWPNEKIAEFVNEQVKANKLPQFRSDDLLEKKLRDLDQVFQNFNILESKLEDLFKSNEAKKLVNTEQFKNLNIKTDDLIDLDQDESLIILFISIELSFSQDGPNSDTYFNTRKNLKILLDMQKISNIPNSLIFNIFKDKWKILILLCDLSFDDSRAHAIDLHNFLIENFYSQILSDLLLVDRKNGSNLCQNLTSVGKLDNTISTSSVSELAKYMPRIKSSIDKNSHLGRKLAAKLNPFTDEKSKIKSYNHYRKCLTNICLFNENLRRDFKSRDPRKYFLIARHNKEVMSSMLNYPLSDSILNPIPEPVDVSSYERMKPLYDWLSENKNFIFKQDNLTFERGTVTSDGRLDLCKQVIGPKGVQGLLDCLSENKNIDRLLLGNNIVGDQGGHLIAEFIKNGKSPLTIWYIAGNNLTEKGFKPIADVLASDTQVTALWLKRNPLKAQGMIHVGNLMRLNTTISTLDLLNCGLLDVGVEILMKSLSENKTLKNLYLSANGLTPTGLRSIKKYWSGNLETLFLGANRIGNEGAKIIAEILKADSNLLRLNMTSSRIGAEGMKFLSESLQNNTSLLLLDLGYMKASMDLGEVGNFIEDKGAEYLAEVFRKNRTLMSLNVNHNHLTKFGIRKLRDALRENTSLIQLEISQHGLHIDVATMIEIEKKLKSNTEILLQTRPDFDIEELFIPRHVKEIYSVYRTH